MTNLIERLEKSRLKPSGTIALLTLIPLLYTIAIDHSLSNHINKVKNQNQYLTDFRKYKEISKDNKEFCLTLPDDIFTHAESRVREITQQHPDAEKTLKTLKYYEKFKFYTEISILMLSSMFTAGLFTRIGFFDSKYYIRQ